MISPAMVTTTSRPAVTSTARAAGALYRVFDLAVASELDLALPLADGNATVDVVLGPVTARGERLWRDEPPFAFACFRDGATITLEWPSARFRVSADQVVVDARDRAVAADLLVPAVWSIVLTARGRESLHGCAVARGGRAVAVLGASGVGKSTAGLALLDRGWRVVTDDLVTFDPAGNAIPGPPFVRLLPDRVGGRVGQLDAAGKLRVCAAACPDPVPLAAMVVLAEEHADWTQLVGVAAVAALLRQFYSPLLTHPDQARQRLELAADLAGRVPVYGAPPRTLTADRLEGLVEVAPA